MNKYGLTGLTALSALALCLGTAPKANATLIVSYNVTGGAGGGTSGFCADGSGCDNSAVANSVGLNAFSDAGVMITGSFSSSEKGPPVDQLQTATTTIVNNSNAVATVTITVGDTSFTAPVSSLSLAGSGTFTGGVGSSATLNFFADTGNGQSTAYNITPGSSVGTSTNASTSALNGGFSYNMPNATFSAANPFSITEQLVVTLAPGAMLTSHGQSAAALVNVPEPVSLAMLGTGLVSIGALRLRRRRS